MKRLCAAAAMAAVLSGVAFAGDGPVSAYDKAHMTPQAFTATLQNHLYDLMEEPDSNATLNQPLTAYSTDLKPTGTEVPDLCRLDRIIFEMTPARNGTPDAHTPMRVAGITISSRFHFLSSPVPGDYDMQMTDDQRADLNRRCASAESKAFTINAPDARTARYGTLVVEALREQGPGLDDNLLNKADFDCAGWHNGCADLTKETVAEESRYAGFSNQCDDAFDSYCVTMGWDGLDMTIRFRFEHGTVKLVGIHHVRYIDDAPITGFRGGDYIK